MVCSSRPEPFRNALTALRGRQTGVSCEETLDVICSNESRRSRSGAAGCREPFHLPPKSTNSIITAAATPSTRSVQAIPTTQCQGLSASRSRRSVSSWTRTQRRQKLARLVCDRQPPLPGGKGTGSQLSPSKTSRTHSSPTGMGTRQRWQRSAITTEAVVVSRRGSCEERGERIRGGATYPGGGSASGTQTLPWQIDHGHVNSRPAFVDSVTSGCPQCGQSKSSTMKSCG